MTQVSGLPIEYVTGQLRMVDLLRTLDEDVISELAGKVEVTDHEPGAVVLEQGAQAAGLHLLFEGTATIERDGVLLAEIGAGDHVGEVALIDGMPRVATVRAATALRTGFLTSVDFLDVLDAHPEMAMDLLVALVARFRQVEERLAALEASLARAEAQAGRA